MDWLAALSQLGRAAVRAAGQATPSKPAERKGVECTPCAANAFLARIHGQTNAQGARKPRKKAR